LAQAVNFVNSKNGSALALTTLRQFLDNIENWDEKAIQKISISDHITNIANKVSEITKIPVDNVRPELLHYSETDGETRKWTKYVMGTLHIPGTPYLFHNKDLCS
jgi:DNA topoisomerase VI subunit B